MMTRKTEDNSEVTDTEESDHDSFSTCIQVKLKIGFSLIIAVNFARVIIIVFYLWPIIYKTSWLAHNLFTY